MRRSVCGWCDHGVGSVLDSPVYRAQPTSLREAGDGSAARGCGRGPQGPAVGSSTGGPGPAGRSLLAHEPHDAAARAAVRVSKSAADRIIDHLGPRFALQSRKRSTNHQVVIDADTRLVVVVGRPLAGNRNDCKAWEESGGQSRRRQDPHDCRQRLPGHRTGHPAPPRARAERTTRLERATQQVPQAGPGSCRACLRPHEDLEDPSRLPPRRRRRPPRHAWHRPDAQPRPRRIGQRATRPPSLPEETRRSFTGQPLVI